MRIRPEQLSPGVRAINAELFAPPAPPGVVREVSPVGDRKAERRAHDEFESWLRLHVDELSYIHARMDAKSTIRKGWPDFTVINKACALVEFKAPGGSLSTDQKEVIAELEKIGAPVLVTESVAEAIEFIRVHCLQ